MSMTVNERKMEAKIEKIMKALDCSREDAIDVIECDKEIDQGKRVYFDVSLEEEKKQRKENKMVARAEKKAPTVYNFETKDKKRKENVEKAGIIAALEQFLAQNTEIAIENVQILNKERQLSFTIGEDTYELTLVQKRKPKK